MLLCSGLAADRAAAAQGDCGIVATTGVKPLASDCLGILQHAVAKTDCVPFRPCVCDVDGSLQIVATDALLCLNVAVKNPAFTLACPCLEPSLTTTTTMTTTTTSTTTTSVSTVSTTSTTLGVSIEAGRAIYDADCAVCHRAGAYDTTGRETDLAGKGNSVGNNLAQISEEMTGLIYDDVQRDSLRAFLNSL